MNSIVVSCLSLDFFRNSRRSVGLQWPLASETTVTAFCYLDKWLIVAFSCTDVRRLFAHFRPLQRPRIGNKCEYRRRPNWSENEHEKRRQWKTEVKWASDGCLGHSEELKAEWLTFLHDAPADRYFHIFSRFISQYGAFIDAVRVLFVRRVLYFIRS